MELWTGNITFTEKEDKNAFRVLSWLAKAVLKEPTRYYMTGVYNEFVDGNRVFVATDGRQIHKVALCGNPEEFAKIPAGKNLAFKARAKQITFTHEIDIDFPNYKNAVPDITGVAHFGIRVNKTKEMGYTEALYELYSRKLRVNSLHIEAMAMPGSPLWEVYACPRDVVVCEAETPGAVYTAVSACLMDA
jgi:hypothetical protein